MATFVTPVFDEDHQHQNGGNSSVFSKKERDQLQKHEELRCAKVAGIMIMIRCLKKKQ